MSAPELHRPIRVARIGKEGMEVVVESTEAERAALAVRMGLPAVTALRCGFALARESGARIVATGRLEAAAVQTCVVSLEDFAAPIVENFVVHFVPEATESDDPDPESVDEIPYAGETIDLGEAVAEQLALALDPYPRRPDARLPGDETATGDPRLAGLAAWRRPDRGGAA